MHGLGHSFVGRSRRLLALLFSLCSLHRSRLLVCALCGELKTILSEAVSAIFEAIGGARLIVGVVLHLGGSFLRFLRGQYAGSVIHTQRA
jgi:hypothetical protein